MKLFVVFASLVLAVNAASDEELWTQFKQDHGKTYRSLREDKLRFGIFQSNLRMIEEHNAKYEKGEETWYMGINEFTDLTDEEFKAQYLSYKPLEGIETTSTFVLPFNATVPDAVDWTEKGAVLSVKNQGQCGSCWAFSAVGALEGQNAIKHGIKTDLSPQELVDCAGGTYKNEGCNGGLMDWAFSYVKDHGISTLADYPYIGRDERCKGSRNSGKIKVTGFSDVAHNEQALKEAVATVGPVSIAIVGDYIKQYRGGIYDNFFCRGQLDHGVLAVGYGSENNHDYWLVKNSWGTTWGNQGFIKMTRNRFNQCGVASSPSYPRIA